MLRIDRRISAAAARRVDDGGVGIGGVGSRGRRRRRRPRRGRRRLGVRSRRAASVAGPAAGPAKAAAPRPRARPPPTDAEHPSPLRCASLASCRLPVLRWNIRVPRAFRGMYGRPVPNSQESTAPPAARPAPPPSPPRRTPGPPAPRQVGVVGREVEVAVAAEVEQDRRAPRPPRAPRRPPRSPRGSRARAPAPG